mmetsp:Transcript_4142/g.9776  ORF Transcript_4142/g.9776 Transcript_4142/m.9776 type:complete len:238 (+) Transcript_4142:698-1411(+)
MVLAGTTTITTAIAETAITIGRGRTTAALTTAALPRPASHSNWLPGPSPPRAPREDRPRPYLAPPSPATRRRGRPSGRSAAAWPRLPMAARRRRRRRGITAATAVVTKEERAEIRRTRICAAVLHRRQLAREGVVEAVPSEATAASLPEAREVAEEEAAREVVAAAAAEEVAVANRTAKRAPAVVRRRRRNPNPPYQRVPSLPLQLRRRRTTRRSSTSLRLLGLTRILIDILKIRYF